MDNVLVDIRTHDEPFAAFVENLRCKIRRIPRNGGSIRFDLVHSALCSDERAIERIVAWLNLQENSSPKPPPVKTVPLRTKATPLGLV